MKETSFIHVLAREYIERNNIDMTGKKLHVFSTKKKSKISGQDVYVNHILLLDLEQECHINLKKAIIVDRILKNWLVNNLNKRSLGKIKTLIDLL
jgi:hypothetical protein